jgi:hypothetical protein
MYVDQSCCDSHNCTEITVVHHGGSSVLKALLLRSDCNILHQVKLDKCSSCINNKQLQSRAISYFQFNSDQGKLTRGNNCRVDMSAVYLKIANTRTLTYGTGTANKIFYKYTNSLFQKPICLNKNNRP